MAEFKCVMCNENRAGGDGLCVKCRFKLNTQHLEGITDRELLLPEGRYFGKTRNGIPNGKGEITYNEHDSRRSYKGDFKDGMRHGKGKLIFKNDASYDGEWMYDKYDGYGEESLPGGNVLEGFYEAGRLINGRVYFGDGREYDGEWSDDMPNGMGKMYFRDGHAEEGFWVDGVCAFPDKPTEEQMALYLANLEHQVLDEFRQEKVEVFDASVVEEEAPNAEAVYGSENVQIEGVQEEVATAQEEPQLPEKKNGYGTEDYPNGEHYEGEFLDDMRHGYGVMTYPNGDRYEGYYQEGKRHGQGKMTYAAGSIYDGEWNNSKKSGLGTFTAANGERYVGEFADGAFHGQGTYYFANGNTYTGTWTKSRRDGEGILTTAEGIKEKQEWKDGKKVSSGPLREFRTLNYKSGNRYEGEVDDSNRPDGIGIYYYSNGSRYEGTFVNGMRDGIGTFVWPTGDCYEGEWKKDKRHGQGRMIYADGHVKEGLYTENNFLG